MAYALLTTFFGLLALWAARYFSREMRRARDWPTTPGKILERGVGDPIGRGRSYMPRVKYSYSVAGKEYRNDQVYVIRRTGNLADKIQRIVNALPDPVPVHYNPEDPTQAYLIANPWSTFWVLVVFGVAVLGVGLLQLLVVLLNR